MERDILEKKYSECFHDREIFPFLLMDYSCLPNSFFFSPDSWVLNFLSRCHKIHTNLYVIILFKLSTHFNHLLTGTHTQVGINNVSVTCLKNQIRELPSSREPCSQNTAQQYKSSFFKHLLSAYLEWKGTERIKHEAQRICILEVKARQRCHYL